MFGKSIQFSEPIYSNDYCVMLQIHEWVKDPLKVLDQWISI